MSANTEDGKPLLASLVQAGEQQTEAIAITDFVHMAKDISNAYLVNTSDGDVLVNTGFITSTERNKSVFAKARSGPLKAIVLTQAHPDHYGGVPAFLEPGTSVIAERRFADTCAFFNMLDPYIRRRSGKLWASTIKNRDALVVPTVTPDVCVDGRYSFSVGERQFEVISTPGGEAPDSVVVWMPAERIVFTGNLFGPVFMSMPNLCTLRGDKPRSARRFLDSLDTVRQLGAELLITGHGEPIRGAAQIRGDLDKLHAAVAYVHQATVDGMNAGTDEHTLARHPLAGRAGAR
ncbi:MAG: MBL fold metallo-hydrolase [Haliea sp.]|nr:MBL fold metallo-hydrolase [Haliea sp.]